MMQWKINRLKKRLRCKTRAELEELVIRQHRELMQVSNTNLRKEQEKLQRLSWDLRIYRAGLEDAIKDIVGNPEAEKLNRQRIHSFRTALHDFDCIFKNFLSSHIHIRKRPTSNN